MLEETTSTQRPLPRHRHIPCHHLCWAPTNHPWVRRGGDKSRVLLTASLVAAVRAVTLSITAPDTRDALVATGAAPLLVPTWLFLRGTALQEQR